MAYRLPSGKRQPAIDGKSANPINARTNFAVTTAASPNHNWRVYGHDWAVLHLQKSMRHRRVRHAYLLVGADSVGKATLARAFAQALLCTAEPVAARPCGECRHCQLLASGNHPDILTSQLDPNSGRLKIEEIRRITGQIALKPFEGRYRITIFDSFDRAQPAAQDALLKTLEEPPPHAILIVLAASAESLLSTITSRSQILPLRPTAQAVVEAVLTEHYGATAEQAALLAHISGGRIGWAIGALHDPELLEQRAAALDLLETCLDHTRVQRFELAEQLARDKQAVLPLLELWQTYWRDIVLLAENSQLPPANYDRRDRLEDRAARLTPGEALAALRATMTTLDGLRRHNINARLALEVMLLRYPLPA